MQYLGALALGDIGLHFPDTDTKWKEADSIIFLSWSLERAKQMNFKLSNIDLTIICEKPKINSYRERELIINLSKICALEDNRINVKATTTERLGFTGREEGIASMCSFYYMKLAKLIVTFFFIGNAKDSTGIHCKFC